MAVPLCRFLVVAALAAALPCALLHSRSNAMASGQDGENQEGENEGNFGGDSQDGDDADEEDDADEDDGDGDGDAEVQGTVTETGDTSVSVGGIEVDVDDATEVDGVDDEGDEGEVEDLRILGTPKNSLAPLQLGQRVRAIGVLKDGVLLATRLKAYPLPRKLPRRSARGNMTLRGRVQEVHPDTSLVNGIQVLAPRSAPSRRALVVGNLVQLRGRLLDDGSVHPRQIRLAR